jgi:glycosyltransferase involved in cell wall biosynthesis
MMPKSLNIAMVAPPPYGAHPPEVEMFALDLAEALSARGHRLTVYGKEGTTLPGVRTVPVFPRDWDVARAGPFTETYWYTYQSRLLDSLRGTSFDLVHLHTTRDAVLVRLLGLSSPLVATVYGRIDGLAAELLAATCGTVRLVATSESQRTPRTCGLLDRAIHVGAKSSPSVGRDDRGDYLLHIGVLNPAGGQAVALATAQCAGVPLVLLGPEDHRDRRCVERLLEHGPAVSWRGPGGAAERAELVAGARALLYTSLSDDSAGYPIVEAAAAGTPVLALDRGVASELVVPGITGHLAREESELADLLPLVSALDREECRSHASNAFRIEECAEKYERFYLSKILDTT